MVLTDDVRTLYWHPLSSEDMCACTEAKLGKIIMRLGSYYRSLANRYIGVHSKGQSILDVGSYDGFFLSQMRALSRVAVDLHPAKQQFHPLLPADVYHLPFREDSFETILALDVLEHLLDDRGAVAALLDILSPNGLLWLSVPCAGFKVFPAWLTNWLHRRWGHVRPGYTGQQLFELVGGQGTVTIRYWNEPVFRLAYLPLRLLWVLFPGVVKWLLRCIVALDALWTDGTSGHIYARIEKVTPRSNT